MKLAVILAAAAFAVASLPLPSALAQNATTGWAPSHFAPAANATTTIPVRNSRAAVTIVNSGGAGLCLTTSQAATSCAGAYGVLPAGSGLTLNTSSAIYMISSSGTGSAEVFETFN